MLQNIKVQLIILMLKNLKLEILKKQKKKKY